MPIEDLTWAELAWMAGFFDGEGCIYIGRRTEAPNTYYLSVIVSQRIRPPLEPFLYFGGSIHRAHQGHVYQWIGTAHTGALLLQALLPYLRVKRDQAIIAIKFQERRLGRGQGHTALGVQTRAARREADQRDWAAVKALKH